jgi:virulence-associated protein VagC
MTDDTQDEIKTIIGRACKALNDVGINLNIYECNLTEEGNTLIITSLRQPTQSNLHKTQSAAEQSFAENANESTGQERQPTQSDALREAVIEECAQALEADAKQCDCFARNEGECGCGAWCEWKSITSARAVEIVRALQKQD